MKLMRWTPRAANPWQELERWSDEVSQYFGEELGAERTWRPAIDVYEEKSRLVVKADLPGLAKADVKIDVEDGVLTISGERNEHRETEDVSVYRTERVTGQFRRSIRLPDNIETGKAKAAFKDGVLTVTLPKAEEERPKKIEIAVN